MEIVHNVDIDMSTRQACKKSDYMYVLSILYVCIKIYFYILAAIFLKNLVLQHWASREDEPEKFSIHEVDKVRIRNSILGVMVTVPDILQ